MSEQIEDILEEITQGRDGGDEVRIAIANQILSQLTVTDDGSFVLASNDGTVIGDVDIPQIEIPDDGGGTNEVERRGTDLKISLENDQTGLATDEDTTHSSGDTGILGLGVRQDQLAALADDGDYIPFVVDDDGNLYQRDGTDSADDDGSGTTTTGQFENVCVLDRSNGDHWTECRPWSNNLGNSSNDHQVRLIQANRPGLDPANAPNVDDISGNADWENVTGNVTVSSGGYWPNLSGSGIEVYSQTIVQQVRDDGQGNTEDTENELSADRAK